MRGYTKKYLRDSQGKAIKKYIDASELMFICSHKETVFLGQIWRKLRAVTNALRSLKICETNTAFMIRLSMFQSRMAFHDSRVVNAVRVVSDSVSVSFKNTYLLIN